MDSKLQLFAKVLLKEHYDEFLEMIQLFNHYCPVKAGKSVFEIVET